MSIPTRIVFFDGHCALCHRTVSRLLRMDTQGRLHFAPQDGETARRLLGQAPRGVDAILYWREKKALEHSSSAVLAILKDLGWPWSSAAMLFWVPAGLRDLLYRTVSARRYRWYGRFDSCPLPDPQYRERFLP